MSDRIDIKNKRDEEMKNYQLSNFNQGEVNLMSTIAMCSAVYVFNINLEFAKPWKFLFCKTMKGRMKAVYNLVYKLVDKKEKEMLKEIERNDKGEVVLLSRKFSRNIFERAYLLLRTRIIKDMKEVKGSLNKKEGRNTIKDEQAGSVFSKMKFLKSNRLHLKVAADRAFWESSY